MRRLLASLLFTAAMMGSALAADCWPNAAGTQANCGVVQMNVNPSGQSVPAAVASGTVGVAAVNTEGTKATYSALGGPTMTANGICLVLKGSATKTIRVTKVGFTASLTTAGLGTVIVNRATGDVTSPSGAFTPAINKLDTAIPAPTGVVTTYATATAGAGAASLAGRVVMFGSATIAPTQATFEFGNVNDQALVLRGTGEYLQLGVTSGSYTGFSSLVYIEWTEE